MIEKVQYITQDNAVLSHSEQARVMFEKGIKWVQLRMKNATEDEIVAEAEKIMRYAAPFQATLILNDDVALAKRIGAKAVHIGLNDMPADEARRILGRDVIIGGTANTLEQLKLQVARGVDYVGVGPFRFTTTKKNLSPVIGLEGYQTLLSQMKESRIDIPLFAVGGITLDDVESLKSVGVEHFAISGDLLKMHLDVQVELDERLS